MRYKLIVGSLIVLVVLVRIGILLSMRTHHREATGLTPSTVVPTTVRIPTASPPVSSLATTPTTMPRPVPTTVPAPTTTKPRTVPTTMPAPTTTSRMAQRPTTTTTRSRPTPSAAARVVADGVIYCFSQPAHPNLAEIWMRLSTGQRITDTIYSPDKIIFTSTDPLYGYALPTAIACGARGTIGFAN